MARRKVHVKVEIDLFLEMEEGVSVSEVVNEMDYGFTIQTDGATLIDTEILGQEVTDSR